MHAVGVRPDVHFCTMLIVWVVFYLFLGSASATTCPVYIVVSPAPLKRLALVSMAPVAGSSLAPAQSPRCMGGQLTAREQYTGAGSAGTRCVLAVDPVHVGARQACASHHQQVRMQHNK